MGKTVAVGATTLSLSLVTTLAMLVVVSVIVGDRPSPIAPWESMSEGVVPALAAVAVPSLPEQLAGSEGLCFPRPARRWCSPRAW
ncbi:hypothetical protein [Saccharomonospora cyanea]|uniref:Uncharacterized protein n=1 Tax=Saccharomonospora cyanea NA-134 TaxID=882082 RepID=H5XNZ3_9PSEU|nr:hypothetical protein [Saccharomonospora cyanea]EHR63242.1 hypothetical protein SaccyDRAFT_4432 [Saccharomonospora cyanea NA-134]